MNFKDIKTMSRANYRVNITWKYLERAINSYEKDYGFNDSPDFQRDHVWTNEQQSKYIEYILKGGMSGREIYLNCTTWDNIRIKEEEEITVVDGKQRLKAVRDFMQNKVTAFGLLLKEFKGVLPHRAEFRFGINDLESTNEVYQWYLDLNDGGNVHTEEELDKVRNLIGENK